MPKYLILGKWIDQGIKTVKEGTQRIPQTLKGVEAAGGKVLGLYFLMGEYDMALLAELPSDEVAAAGMLCVGAQGNLRSTTLKAFTADEFIQILKRMP